MQSVPQLGGPTSIALVAFRRDPPKELLLRDRLDVTSSLSRGILAKQWRQTLKEQLKSVFLPVALTEQDTLDENDWGRPAIVVARYAPIVESPEVFFCRIRWESGHWRLGFSHD